MSEGEKTTQGEKKSQEERASETLIPWKAFLKEYPTGTVLSDLSEKSKLL